MSRLICLGVFMLVVAALAACGILTYPPKDQPPSGANTEFPCGTQWKTCNPVATGMCCPLSAECGYEGPWSTCAKGSCCSSGTSVSQRPAFYKQ